MGSPVTNCFILSAACALFAVSLEAQPFQKDSSSRLAEEHALSLYHHSLGGQSALYNGIGHLTYDPALHGTPYLLGDSMVKGNVWYDGLLYRNVPMLYDQVRDQLIIADPFGFLVTAYTPRVQDFFLLNHHFVCTAQGQDPKGYYDQVCSGALTILVKRHKRIDESIVGLELIHSIAAFDYFYAVKGNTWHSVNSEKSLLALMSDKKQAMKQFIRANHIRFRKDPEQALIRITDYYNQLSQ